ncbi:hypothetical protein [Collinsella ureilytica]|nr:hypothetical protein [Collinsella urealyticum]
MGLAEVAAPIFFCVIAIALTAGLYFAVTALKDRSGRRRADRKR